jgi:two-component system, OmpR family, response regulator
MRRPKTCILLVEDYVPLAENIERYLALKDYDVKVVPDGKQGLYEAVTGDYDCVILDIGLPEMDGLSVAEGIRREGKDVPILMLTSRSRTEDVVAGLSVGADDYLTKPFDYRELLARIESLVRRSQGRVETVVTVGPLVIDADRREVTWFGQILECSGREYELLTYLAHRAGQVVSREELLREVWGNPDEFSTTKTLDVYIGYLRKKLGVEAITTRKGFGYALTVESAQEPTPDVLQ